MYARHWVKLYYGMLNSRKVTELTDRLWRRAIELLLVDSRNRGGGILPSDSQMAWELRIAEDVLALDLIQLEGQGFLSHDEKKYEWTITDLIKRQTPVTVTEHEMCVYIVGNDERKLYKIGVTTNLERRLKELSVTAPFAIHEVHRILADDGRECEHELHFIFAKERENGEWFRLKPCNIEWLKSMKEYRKGAFVEWGD